MKASLLLGHR